MQFFTRKTLGCNILFNSANKEIFYVLSVPMIMWQETMVTVKKRSFTSVSQRECLVVFHAVWTC
jgi:hypothetical protein